MTLHPIIQTIKRAAPEWAGWLCVTRLCGIPWWQSDRGHGPAWTGATIDCKDTRWAAFEPKAPFAIDLTTGAIHLQSDDGTITVVSQDEWGAEE